MHFWSGCNDIEPRIYQKCQKWWGRSPVRNFGKIADAPAAFKSDTGKHFAFSLPRKKKVTSWRKKRDTRRRFPVLSPPPPLWKEPLVIFEDCHLKAQQPEVQIIHAATFWSMIRWENVKWHGMSHEVTNKHAENVSILEVKNKDNPFPTSAAYITYLFFKLYFLWSPACIRIILP